MSHRRTSRGNRFLSLVVSELIAVTVAATLGIMVQLVGKPDELDLLRVLPWVIGGLLLGFGVWYVLASDGRPRSSRRKGGHPI